MLLGIKKGIKIVRIGFIVLAVYVAIISIFTHVIQKNRPVLTNDTVKQNRTHIYKTINDEKLKSTKEGRLYISLYRFSTCRLVGEGCTDIPQDGDINVYKSFAGGVAQLIAMPLLNPPASSISWVSQGLAKAGFIPKIYAAEGIGFASIRPLMGLWKAFRDVAYLLLVLVVVTIGFMIMFRTKINPQTVVSVENALPKIVMSLIYITFSFPIAGFLIDLMYVVTAIIISVVAPVDKTSWGIAGTSAMDVQKMQNFYLSARPMDIFTGLFGNKNGFNPFTILLDLPNALISAFGTIPNIVIRIITSGLSIFFLFPWIKNHVFDMLQVDITARAGVNAIAEASAEVQGLWKTLFNMATKPFGLWIAIGLGAIITPLIIGVIIFITTLMLFFRIFLTIMSSYIKILLLVIISPLYLLLEAIPGQSTFSGWIKNIISELIIFPLIIGIFIISIVIMDNTRTGALWAPPFMLGIEPSSMAYVIGMWFLFMTPDLVALVQKMLNPKPLPLDAGLGTFFGGATTGISTGLGEVSKYAVIAPKIGPLKRIFENIPMLKDIAKGS